MKTKNIVLILAALAGFVIFAASCEEFPDIPTLPREEAQTHILNLLGPDRVDVTLETAETEVSFGERIPFGGGYPQNGYASLPTRTENADTDSQRAPVFITAKNTFSRQAVLDRALFFLNPNIHTTVAMIDSFGKAKVLRAADTYPEFTADTTAIIRYMNLAYHLPSTSFRSMDSTIWFERYNFLTFTSFTEVPAGTYSFDVIEDGSGFAVTNLQNIELVPGKHYNFWFTWRSGQSVAGVEEMIID
ncbi:MAG: hypothetical protein R3B47_04815 [Bacteroidia bacterium]